MTQDPALVITRAVLLIKHMRTEIQYKQDAIDAFTDIMENAVLEAVLDRIGTRGPVPKLEYLAVLREICDRCDLNFREAQDLLFCAMARHDIEHEQLSTDA